MRLRKLFDVAEKNNAKYLPMKLEEAIKSEVHIRDHKLLYSFGSQRRKICQYLTEYSLYSIDYSVQFDACHQRAL